MEAMKEETLLLRDSNFCRLCGEENEHGIDLFLIDENSTNLQQLVNKYLPIVVEKDEKFPKCICPGCHIQLESTKLFLDLVVEGQSRLRSLFKNQQEHYQQQTQIKIYTSTNYPLYIADHALRLQAEGLDRPRRKRGRPPKKIVPEEEQDKDEKEQNKKSEEEVEEVGADGRKRRRIRPPLRFQGVVQGKELEDMFKKEGVLDEEGRSAETRIRKEEVAKSFEVVIGRTEGEYGEDLGKPVFINRTRTKPKSSITAMTFKRIDIGSYECKICLKKFIHEIHFNEHLKSHEIEGLNTSILENEPILGNNTQEFTNAISLVENLNPSDVPGLSSVKTPGSQETNENNTHICKKCNKTFQTLEAFKIHSEEHNKSRKFTCDICGKVLQHSSSLLYHKQTEHNNYRFVCNTCNKIFKHRQLLQRHQIVHSEDRPFVCPICDASFKTHANLMNHEAVHTGEKKFECSKCNQKFAHKTSLSLHQRWHEGKKPFTCEFCQKSFSQNSNLLEHKRIHTGEKPFFCEVCAKSFTTSSQLRIHMKRHTGEKPWKCDICGKSFLHRDSYKGHVRRHLNERPYVCQLCCGSFTQAWDLKKHMRIHTGEKPFKCELCEKTFSDKSNKDKHLRTHNKYQRYNVTSDITLPSIMKREEPSCLQFTQLVDQQGNPISVTTQDGQTVPVVTSGDDDSNLQGLMPDGTLVPIEIAAIQEKDEEMSQGATLDLIETTSSDAMALQESLQHKELVRNLNSNFQLLTNNDGEEVCLVTYSIQEDGALSQELLESALIKD